MVVGKHLLEDHFPLHSGHTVREDAGNEQDAAKQKALWAAAQKKIVEAVCAVPIYENLQLWAWKDNLDLGYELKGSLNLSPPITEMTQFKN